MDQLPLFIKNVGSLGYSLNAFCYFLLALLLITSWKKSLFGALLLIAVSYQVVWSGILAYQGYTHYFNNVVLIANEDIRLMLWIVFLVEILRRGSSIEKYKNLGFLAYFILAVLLVLNFVLEVLNIQNIIATSHYFTYVLDLLLATFGLILTEQFYRNAKQEKRWAIKFLCIAVGLLFAYDLYMYSHATLFEGVDSSLWNARGFVNIVIAPLILISAARNKSWSFNVFVSRHIVFYTSGLLAIGIYMSLMAFFGYYIKIYGGDWGKEAQIIFFAGALVVLFIIISSGKLRANIKLFINKHFYENKYDYREEWMGFIEKLSHIESPKYFKEQILQTVAGIIHSRGAILYLKKDDKYTCISSWNAEAISYPIEMQSPLVSFFHNHEWIIDIDEYRQKPQNYPDLIIPEEILQSGAWLVIPLKHYYDLLGFIVLLEPFASVKITWEDRDLLKAIGKQVSSYLAFVLATESLNEAEKFAAFNRLSAFVVHDMKNSVAQLDLIIKNAENHKNNPEFVSDAFLTVSNVVDRMKRMLSQLRRSNHGQSGATPVSVNQILYRVIDKCADREPKPELLMQTTELFVNVEPDRFANVIEHLINNAQDATDKTGRVYVKLSKYESDASIEIEDTGSGMTQEFINNHLFKPFDTTKGNAGMGVGVFEAKEFVKFYQGNLDVKSKPGVGTTFTLRLPVYHKSIAFDPIYG